MQYGLSPAIFSVLSITMAILASDHKNIEKIPIYTVRIRIKRYIFTMLRGYPGRGDSIRMNKDKNNATSVTKKVLAMKLGVTFFEMSAKNMQIRRKIIQRDG
jgi:hypothetical protein